MLECIDGIGIAAGLQHEHIDFREQFAGCGIGEVSGVESERDERFAEACRARLCQADAKDFLLCKYLLGILAQAIADMGKQMGLIARIAAKALGIENADKLRKPL